MGCTYLYQGQQFKTKEALVSFLNKGEEDYSPSFDYKIKPEEYFNNTDKIVAKILTNEPIEDIEDVLDASLLLIKFSDNKLLEGFEYTSTFRKYYDAKFKYQSGYTEDFKSRLASIGTEEELKNPKSLSKEKRKKYNEYNRYLRMVKAEVFSDVVMNRKNEEKNIEVKTLFDKIVEFFKNLFSNKVQSIELFEQLADTIINSAKQKIIYTDIKFPDNNYKAINFNEVVSKSDIGNYVISNLDNTGFLLTGSLSYSPFGNIYRNPDNMLHDIDMVSNKSRDESVEIIMKTYPNSEIIYDISKWMVTFIIPQKGSVIKNIQRKGGEKSLVKSYEVWKDNVKVGDFTLDYDVNEFGEVTTREEIKVGEEATFVDVFYDQKNNVKTTNYNYNGKNVKLNDPVEGFKAKISLSREKDIIDLLKFGKEDDADYSPSFDSVKPGVEGLFNDNPELSSIGTKEEYSQYLNSIFPDSKVKDIVYHGSYQKIEKFEIHKEPLIHFGTKNAASQRGDVMNQVILNIKDLQTIKDGMWFLGNDEGGLLKELFDRNLLTLDEVVSINKVKNEAIINSYSDHYGARIAEGEKAGSKRLQEILKDSDIGFEYINFSEDKGSKSYAVPSQKQIHILGSKQDIQGFKDFVNINKSFDRDEKIKEENKYYDQNTFRSKLYSYFTLSSDVPLDKFGKMKDLSNNNNLNRIAIAVRNLNKRYIEYGVGALVNERFLSEKKPFIKFYENNLDELMKQKWFHGNLEDKPKDKIC